MQGGSKPYLGVESVLEDFTEGFGVILRLARLRGEQYGGFHPLGHGLAHELGRELHGPAEKERGKLRMKYTGQEFESCEDR